MHRCLFLDDAHIAHMCGLTRRAHPAKRHPANPLLTKAHPWEHMRFQLYGRCVVYNPQRKRYQLFYIAQPAADHYPNLTVGGSTKGSAVTASINGFTRRSVIASHHAKGVPITSNTSVVTNASRKLRNKGARSRLMGADIRTLPTP